MAEHENRLKNLMLSALLVILIAVAVLVVSRRIAISRSQTAQVVSEVSVHTESVETAGIYVEEKPEEVYTDSQASSSEPIEITLFGKTVGSNETYLDLSSYSDSEISSEIGNLAELKSLTEINFMKSDGTCSAEEDTLISINSVLPDTILDCSFELFGKVVSSKDERVEFVKESIGNDGEAELRKALPLLHSCNYFLLDNCGIDNEVLAGLREDFPDRNIVWRIFMKGNDSYLTDITVFRCTKICDDDVEQFKYCSAIKYIDVGHTLHNLSDISFTQYMPNLEVLILAHSDVSDLSPLSYCKNLEYLEIFSTKVTDISPLAECENLQHLNITCQSSINDLTPLYGLKKMKRLRLDYYYFPQEQLDTISRLMPDCAMEFGDGDDVLGGWRYYLNKGVPEMASRYALLREQLQYGNGDFYVK